LLRLFSVDLHRSLTQVSGWGLDKMNLAGQLSRKKNSPAPLFLRNRRPRVVRGQLREADN
jgi:hypothetical protein